MPDGPAPTPAPAAPPTVAAAEAIAALDDPVIRNLQITQCYWELSQHLAHYLPGGANWCTVATWASRQAGQSIRREDLRRAFERLINDSREIDEAAVALEAQGAQALGDNTESLAGAAVALKEALSPAAAFDRVSAAVAVGNQKVFAEIGLAFARFLALLGSGPPTAAAVDAFCDGLQPGDPPDGQDYLRRAFRHYHAAMSTRDAKARAQLALLANLEIGFHEQTRLQPDIRAALDAPIYDPVDLHRRLLRELLPNPAGRIRLALLRLSGRAADLLAANDRLAATAQQLARQLITERLMTLELARGRVLQLGDDLRGEIPALLQTLDNGDLRVILDQMDPTPDSLSGTGTHDWSDLGERMHFIADLFRAHHLDEALFDTPFTPEQTAALKDGRLPADL